MGPEPIPRFASPRPVWVVVGMLAIGGLTVACSSSDAGHHEDAGSDASFDADGALDASDGGVSEDGGQSPCAPACTSSQVCCVDQHGHLPRCVEGSACPPPLLPPDAG